MSQHIDDSFNMSDNTLSRKRKQPEGQHDIEHEDEFQGIFQKTFLSYLR